MKQDIEQQTKIGELLSGDNEFTSVRVSKNTLNALAKRGKFRDTFEDIIQRMITETDDKLGVPRIKEFLTCHRKIITITTNITK